MLPALPYGGADWDLVRGGCAGVKRTPTEVERRARLKERLRAEFIAGAEEESRRRLGRGLTKEELERVLRRYPGDV